MNIELVLRLAKEAGLSDEGLAKLKRDLELFQEGVQSAKSQSPSMRMSIGERFGEHFTPITTRPLKWGDTPPFKGPTCEATGLPFIPAAIDLTNFE